VHTVKVERPDEIQAYGVRATPAVVIADRVVHSGGIPSHETVRTWFEPAGVGFLNHPTRFLFFTGKGGVGKTSLSSAAALTLADAGKRVLLVSTDAASNLDEMLGIELRNTPVAVPGAPGLSVLNIDPDNAAQAYRLRVLAQMERDRLLRRVLGPAGRRRRVLGPHRLRHGAHRPHLAPAQPAPGVDGLPERQRPRCLVSRAPFGPEDAGGAVQGRA